MRNPPVQGTAFPASATLERTMTRHGRLIRATDRQIVHHEYQNGLQAMWEDRWTPLGAKGRSDGFQRHGVHPLVASMPMHGIRRLITGGQTTPFGLNLSRIRRAL
jgi:hypothetical protein